MYELFRQLIGYTYTGQMYSYETYILYGCISIVILLCIYLLDMVCRLIRSFIRK